MTRVLYHIVCGAPVARHAGRLVALSQADGWDVCVVTTPDGRKFVDVPALSRQTGHPVRSAYKDPGDPDVLPLADAIIVAPATVNTVNKWAAGIADTLALGLLVEGQGKRLPIVAIPFTNAAMADHPAFHHSIARLRGWGVTVLFGDDVVRMHPPGTGEQHLEGFPWKMGLDALRARMPAAGHADAAGERW
jgi:Flavoprotein